MSRPPFLFAVFALVICTSSYAKAGDIVDFSLWELGTVVNKNTVRDSVVNYQPQTPFQVTHNAAIGLSTSTTTYDVTWNTQELSFMLDAGHQLADVPNTQTSESRSSGAFWFATVQPMLVTFALDYNFNLPGTDFYNLLNFAVIDDTNDITLFGEADQGGPGIFMPATGTHAIQGSAIIPGGIQVLMGYNLITSSFGGSTSIIATASGHVSIHMEVIPEPHTALMLLCAAPFAFIRWRSISFYS